jgi:DNA repair exonuclease SbcCD ATPase subunit
MTIAFHSIKYKNFLSSGNKFIELSLNKHNNTLITGKNGEGKSTFLDAITFALYNKPFRKINKPQLINNINKSDLVTEVIFEANNNLYKIIRGMKPNIFEIYENNKLINQDASNRDYQSFLEQNILKMNLKSILMKTK